MKAKIVLILMVVLLGFPLAVACAREAPPPPTAEEPKGEIVFGSLEDLSGPTAGIGAEWINGIKDCVRYINEEKGGVRGHKLRQSIFDYKMEAALAISGWERMKSENAVVVTSAVGQGAPIITNAAQDDHIPLLCTSGATMEQMYPTEPSYYFSASDHSRVTFISVVELMEEDWKQRGQSGSPKVAFDVTSFGNTGKVWAKGAKLAVEAKGWDYIITRTGLKPTDVTTQVLQMKQFDPDYVYLMNIEEPVIAFLKEFERQNFHPITFATFTLSGKNVWDAVGELAAGIPFYTTTPQWWDTDNESIVLARELNARWHPEVTYRTVGYFRGFFSFTAAVEAMGMVIDNVGYENLDGEAVKEVWETIRDFEPMGSGIRYTWTPNDHRGIQGIMWHQWTKEGTIEKVQDWFIPGPMPEEQRTDKFWLTD